MVISSVGPPRPGPEPTLFDAVGGAAFFERLVEEFYVRVEADSVLLGLYPEPEDLGPARDRLCLFLIQYFGGPTTYSDQRGHPRLRMRHHPYVITDDGRDRWLAAMLESVAVLDPDPAIAEALRQYFVMAADAMVNSR